MKTPTKKQLTDAVNHYQAALNAIIEGPFLSADDLLEEVKAVVCNAPSLEPQPKAVSTEYADNLTTEMKDGVWKNTSDVVDPEAPANV
jgi:hypothetical protein